MKKGIIALIVSLVVVGILAVVGITYAAISSDKKDKGANVRLQVHNVNDQTSSNTRRDNPAPPGTYKTTPDYLGIKLLAAYIAEDIDPQTYNNVGATEIIYLNPQCKENIRDCGVNPNNDSIFVTDYFNFARSSAEVNEELGSQQRTVSPGSYKYVRLEFCKYGTGGSPNFAYRAGNMTSNFEFSLPMCTITQLASEMIVVSEQDTVTITLSYNLTDSVFVSDTPFQAASSTPTSPSYYLLTPEFIPSASVNR